MLQNYLIRGCCLGFSGATPWGGGANGTAVGTKSVSTMATCYQRILQHSVNRFLIGDEKVSKLWMLGTLNDLCLQLALLVSSLGPLIFCGCILDEEPQECHMKGIAKDRQIGQLITLSVSPIYDHKSCPKIYKMGRLGKYAFCHTVCSFEHTP